MDIAFETRALTKTYGETHALADVTLRARAGSVIGLIGRNGSGKTTLLRHVVGLSLPTSGECITLGRPSAELGPDELARIGMVHQDGRHLSWMRVEDHLAYIGSFYARWDDERQRRLARELELDLSQRVGELSPGNKQKMALVMAVCHRPALLILDEPVGAMDPIVRERLLGFLLEMVREDGSTTIVSSHAMLDVERLVEHVVCLDRGRVRVDASLDELHESYTEWIVTGRAMPERFSEPYVLEQRVNGARAQLIVKGGDDSLTAFRERYGVDVERRPMNLERLFPHLVGE
jgi:ABC-2 type transport system ATP-binding protein